jgi:hypothetical protein
MGHAFVQAPASGGSMRALMEESDRESEAAKHPQKWTRVSRRYDWLFIISISWMLLLVAILIFLLFAR